MSRSVLTGMKHSISRKAPWVFKQMLKARAGYVSLAEATATTAVGLTLVATLTPVIISATDDAKVTRAASDVESIRLAITNFTAGVTEAPVRATVGQKVSFPARQGETPMLCTRSGNTPVNDPIFIGICDADTLGGTVVLRPLTSGDDEIVTPGAFLNNHLVFDGSVNMTLKYRQGGGATTPPRDWKGPYINDIKTDPWGRNYIVLSAGFVQSSGIIDATDPNSLSGQVYAWILSAGPDGVLDTKHTDSRTQGDDVSALAAVFNQSQFD